MSRSKISTIFFALVCIWCSFVAFAVIEIYEFDSLEQEHQFKELGNILRCPKCQNNTIADSNAALAQDLRHKVYEMTKEGQSKQEIIDYMIARYGNFVTYDPPFNLATSILWIAPIAILFSGIFIMIWRHKTKTGNKNLAADDDWDVNKDARLQALLNEENNREHKK